MLIFRVILSTPSKLMLRVPQFYFENAINIKHTACLFEGIIFERGLTLVPHNNQDGSAGMPAVPATILMSDLVHFKLLRAPENFILANHFGL